VCQSKIEADTDNWDLYKDFTADKWRHRKKLYNLEHKNVAQVLSTYQYYSGSGTGTPNSEAVNPGP